jgi:hypothetical protein
VRQHGPPDQERAAYVDGVHAIEARDVAAGQRLVDLDAGAVDHDVHGSEPVGRDADAFRHGGLRGHVHGERRIGVSLGRLAIEADHARAGLRQRQRRGPADAARRAGHDRALAPQAVQHSVHEIRPSRGPAARVFAAHHGDARRTAKTVIANPGH